MNGRFALHLGGGGYPVPLSNKGCFVAQGRRDGVDCCRALTLRPPNMDRSPRSPYKTTPTDTTRRHTEIQLRSSLSVPKARGNVRGSPNVRITSDQNVRRIHFMRRAGAAQIPAHSQPLALPSVANRNPKMLHPTIRFGAGDSKTDGPPPQWQRPIPRPRASCPAHRRQ